jgi:hypothetical protein
MLSVPFCGALASHRAAFAGPWPEGPVPEMAQELWSWTPSWGWVWNIAGAGRLLTGLGELTKGGRLSGRGGTGCCDGGMGLRMYSRGTGASSSGSLCRTELVSFWSLGFITWATKTLLCPFLLAQNQTQGGMVWAT